MPRVEKLTAWNEESQKELDALRKKALDLNKNSDYDENGIKSSFHIIKLYDSKQQPYFLLQKRTYAKRFSQKKECLTDPTILGKIKELQAKGYSINKMSKELNISCFYINKILACQAL